MLPVLVAYQNVFEVGFVWDDHVLVEQNRFVHSFGEPWRFFTSGFFDDPLSLRSLGGFYRPFITLTFAVDWLLGGGSPFVFHLSNLVLHLIVCALVFHLARRLGASDLSAVAATALFGTMPRLTESVTWISGRSDVWATALVLGALLLETERTARWWTPLAVAVLLLLGLFSKEIALAGFVVLAGTWWRSKSLPKRPAVALSVGLLTWAAARGRALGWGPTAEFHSLDIFLARLGHQLAMIASPWHPTPQRGFILEPETWAMGLGAMVLVAAGGALWALWRRDRPLLFGLACGASFASVLTAAVVLRGVFPIMSDRYLYLPLALVAVLGAAAPLPRWVLAPASALLVSFVVSTWRQNGLWSNELRLWQATAADASPRNAGVLLSLGDALFAADRAEDAQRKYELALGSLRGRLATATRLSIATTLSRRGLDADALAMLQGLRDDEPDWRRAWLDAALFKARALDFRGARQELDQFEARFGSDDTSAALRRQIAGAAEVLSAAASEPLARAEALSDLGSISRAQALFAELLAIPDRQRTAARWLVVHGDRQLALEGLRFDLAPEASRIYQERWPELPRPQ
jgi:tetratricopeptide (TPR) repeat protein